MQINLVELVDQGEAAVRLELGQSELSIVLGGLHNRYCHFLKGSMENEAALIRSVMAKIYPLSKCSATGRSLDQFILDMIPPGADFK